APVSGPVDARRCRASARDGSCSPVALDARTWPRSASLGGGALAQPGAASAAVGRPSLPSLQVAVLDGDGQPAAREEPSKLVDDNDRAMTAARAADGDRQIRL